MALQPLFIRGWKQLSAYRASLRKHTQLKQFVYALFSRKPIE